MKNSHDHKSLPSVDRLQNLLQYDENSGIVIYNDKIVTSKRITIDGQKYRLSRLLWKMKTGEDPTGNEIDHKNGDGFDNRWKNLRKATYSQNSINIKKPKDNSSGYKGITFRKHINKYEVQISVDKKQKSFGCFEKLEDAIICLETNAKSIYGEFYRKE